jgi:hypothetical protein
MIGAKNIFSISVKSHALFNMEWNEDAGKKQFRPPAINYSHKPEL